MKAVFEGGQAFNEGFCRDACPYSSGMDRVNWLSGWDYRAEQDREAI